MNHRFLIIVASLVLASAWLFAAAPPPPATRPGQPTPKPRLETLNEIIEQFSSPDPAARQQAAEALKQRLSTPRGLSELRSTTLKQIAATGQHKEIVDLCQELLIPAAADTRTLEAILQTRIKSLLALGRADDALVDAKRLFNVSSMLGTSEAILTFAQCLNASKPNDPATFNKFREEQMAGATTQPAFNTSPDIAKKSTILQAVKVEPKPYLDAAVKITGEDAPSLLMRGNLLLLADDVKSAREVFERLYSLSSSDLSEASEALARCMKAEDGTIGRANTWILSIRPKGR